MPARLSRRVVLNSAGAVLATCLLLFAEESARTEAAGAPAAFGLASANATSLEHLQLQAQVASCISRDAMRLSGLTLVWLTY
jgi:threonine dehydratase